MGFDLKYYLSAGMRRLPVFLTILMATTALMSYIAIKLPPIYDANATLLVESPQISPDLVASTVQVNPAEMLQIMEQELMTRPNLIEIANQQAVYPDITEVSADEIVERMSGQTEIQLSAGRDRATLMTVTFYSDRPRVAARVTNEYVTRILENSNIRSEQVAKDAENFFRAQVDRLGSELDRQATRIAQFKTENSGALPDTLEFRLARQTQQQEKLLELQRSLTVLRDRREQQLAIFENTGQVQVDVQRELTNDERRLEAARNQLNDALSVYSTEHPRVKLLQNQIRQLEAQIANVDRNSSTNTVPTNTNQDPAATLLQLQLADLDSEIRSTEEQIIAIEEELVVLKESIERTPSNAITLEGLEREYQNTQEQYNRASSNLATASSSTDIETGGKGVRLTVIDQAVVPTAPSSPNRPLIAGGGIVLGFILGTLAVVLLELLNKSIRRPMDLTKGLGISPLVTIPYIRTRREIFMSRLRAVAIPLAVTGVAAAALFAVDQFVMPLDLVLEKITDRFDL